MYARSDMQMSARAVPALPTGLKTVAAALIRTVAIAMHSVRGAGAGLLGGVLRAQKGQAGRHKPARRVDRACAVAW